MSVADPTDLFRQFAPPPADADADDERGFATGRVGGKPQLTLVLRLASGDCRGFPYAYVTTFDYLPSVGIALTCGRHRVFLRGRHLGPLYDQLCEHKVRSVQEVDRLHAELLPAEATVVTGIEIRLLGAEDLE